MTDKLKFFDLLLYWDEDTKEWKITAQAQNTRNFPVMIAFGGTYSEAMKNLGCKMDFFFDDNPERLPE